LKMLWTEASTLGEVVVDGEKIALPGIALLGKQNAGGKKWPGEVKAGILVSCLDFKVPLRGIVVKTTETSKWSLTKKKEHSV